MLTVAFLLFAQVFWPSFAPVAAALNEPDLLRRRLMRLCLVAGIGVSAYFFWRIATGPHQAVIARGCIVYDTGETHPELVGLAYLAATGLPLLLSSQRAIFVLGVIVSIGCMAAYRFYQQAFLSVWCFFAAGGSAVILAHFELNRRQAARLIRTGS